MSTHDTAWPRDLTATACVALYSVAVGVGFARVFSGWPFLSDMIAIAIVGHGLSFAANAGLSRAIAVVAGPIGWLLSTLWLAIDLAGPAYRVTIPCVIHVAQLRLGQSARA